MKHNGTGQAGRWRRAAMVFLVLSAALPCARAQEPGLPPVPRAEDIEPTALEEAARGSLALAVRNLLSKAGSNDLSLAVQPAVRRTVVINRYTKKMIDEPIYKYETYETRAFVKGSSAADVGRFVKSAANRVVGVTGTQRVERLIGDANGPIAVTNIQEMIWQSGFLGDNAMALYALRRCGVAETNETLAHMARTLNNYVTGYGMPDGTWNVAWLAAALSTLQGEAFTNNRARLVNKLLRSQVTEGPARGLWGPVCVNADVLAAVLGYEQALGDEQAKHREKLARLPTLRASARRIEQIEAIFRDMQGLCLEVSQQGFGFDAVTGQLLVQPVTWAEGCEYPVIISGLPYYIYNQTLADIENTSLALFALREAAAAGCLPAKTAKLAIAAGPPVVPPQETEAILARALAALAGLQKKDGGWDEGNIDQPTTAFTASGLVKSPLLSTESVLALQSPLTLLSTAQGCAAMIDAGRAVGLGKVQNRYGRNLALGRSAQQAAVDLSLAAGTNRPPLGGQVPPYSLDLKLTGLDRLYGGRELDRRDLWERVAYLLVNLQNPDGTWGASGGYSYSSSLWAKQDAIFRQTHAEKQRALPESKRAAYDPKPYWSTFRWPWWPWASWQHHGTCFAMIFLADGLRMPVAGYLTFGASSAPAVLTRAVESVSSRKGLALTFLRVDPRPGLSRTRVRRLPLLYVDDAAALTNRATAAVIREYLTGGGLLAVETGTMPAAEIEAGIVSLAEQAHAGEITTNASFVVKSGGPAPHLRGVFGSGGEFKALLLPPPASEAAAAQAAGMLSWLVETRTDARTFSPCLFNDPETYQAARVSALKGLSEARPIPESVPPAALALADGAAPPRPAATNAPARPAAKPAVELDEETALPVPAKVAPARQADETL